MSSRREELLAGITSLNRRKFDARDDSEEAAAEVGAIVAGVTYQREARVTSDPEGSVRPDKSNQQADEVSLEDLLRAQVVSKYAARDEVKSELFDSEDRTSRLRAVAVKLMEEINILEGVLDANYRRTTSADGEVSEEEQCPTDATKEND